MLALYARQLWRRKQLERDDIGLQYAIVTLAFPFGFVFFTGVSSVLGNLFLAALHYVGLLGTSLTADDWNFGLSLLLPGLAGGAVLWKDLDSIGYGGRRVSIPGRIYILLFLAGTLGAAVIGGVIWLYIVVVGLLGIHVDPTGTVASRAFAVAVTTAPAARYYLGLVSHFLKGY
jgi:hypothetical protein